MLKHLFLASVILNMRFPLLEMSISLLIAWEFTFQKIAGITSSKKPLQAASTPHLPPLHFGFIQSLPAIGTTLYVALIALTTVPTYLFICVFLKGFELQQRQEPCFICVAPVNST